MIACSLMGGRAGKELAVLMTSCVGTNGVEPMSAEEASGIRPHKKDKSCQLEGNSHQVSRSARLF